MQFQAEARLAARRRARAEQREFRMKELEKQHKQMDNNSDRHYHLFNNNNNSNSDPLRSSSTTATTSATKAYDNVSESRCSSHPTSRRSSEEFYDDNRDKDAMHQLNELEDKYKKSMIKNNQLDNDKRSYSYQIELYKDVMEELEENHIRIQRDYKEKSRAYDQLNRDFKRLQEEHEYVKECLRQREELIEDAGLVVIDSDETNHINQLQCSHMNGDISDKRSESIGDESGSESGISGSATALKIPNNTSLITQEAAQLLTGIEGYSLEAKLKTLFTEKKLMLNEINQLKSELEDEKHRTTKLEELTLLQGSNQSINSSEAKTDAQREANKLVSDYRFKLKKCEQEISALQASIARYETQIARFRNSAEEAEKLEDELKADKRKLQRELRETLARIEELETSNAHLQKRIDKLKSSRNIVISK